LHSDCQGEVVNSTLGPAARREAGTGEGTLATGYRRSAVSRHHPVRDVRERAEELLDEKSADFKLEELDFFMQEFGTGAGS
jgi:hypothetical protein